MPSFRTTLTPHKRVAARFVVGVRRAIQKGMADASSRSGLTQTAVANSIGVHRSVVSREIRGASDMTLGRVAELAWAMGMEPHFELRRPSDREVRNIVIPQTGASIAGPSDISSDLNQIMAA